ncbi:MAG: hypothetical protein KDB86_02590 [Actinobacteria bacterium]|nr:hypothetical protein [Actinomycetota bacterium]MCB9388774.1 hypothetical protein [Acidimicrobiia bacterium]
MATEQELGRRLRNIAETLDDLILVALRDQLEGDRNSGDERRLGRARRAVLKAAELLDPQTTDW